MSDAVTGSATVIDEHVDGLAVYRHRPGPPSGATRVLMVHGSMDRAASFLKVTRRLSELEVVRYDRRGYGRSVGAGLCSSIDEQADDLLAVVADRPTVVVGHSLGGVIALVAAVRRPDLVPSVAAYESPMAWLDWWPRSSAGGAAVQASRDGGPEEAAERFMRGMVGDRVWERLPERTRRQRRSEGPALLADLATIRGRAPYDPALVPVPVLAGHGTMSKPYHQQAARLLAERAPDGELVVVEGSGHACPTSHPDEFAAFVRRAVDRAGPSPR